MSPPYSGSDPLGSGLGLRLRCLPGEVGEAGLPEVLWLGPLFSPLRRSLGRRIGLFVSGELLGFSLSISPSLSSLPPQLG